MINGSVHFTEPGIVQNIRAMRMQMMLMGIANENITGFDKVGYQRKIPVVSSFAEYIGDDALSTTIDDTVGRLFYSENPLDVALAEKGYFQVQSDEGIKLTRDGRFMMDKNGGILTMDGAKVLTNMGTPLVLPFVPDKLDDITIDLNGVVRVLNNKTSIQMFHWKPNLWKLCYILKHLRQTGSCIRCKIHFYKEQFQRSEVRKVINDNNSGYN